MIKLGALLLCVSGAAIGIANAEAQQGEDVSNPLWSTPLDALSVTRERPLFSQSRRQPALASPQAVAEAPIAGGAPPPLVLVGTLVGERERIALILESDTQNILRLPVGGTAAGCNITDVATRSVTLTRGPQSVTLELPKPLAR